MLVLSTEGPQAPVESSRNLKFGSKNGKKWKINFGP